MEINQNITSLTIVELFDIDLYHAHIKGKHKGMEHAHTHKGDLTLTFEAQNGIAFYVSKEAVDELTNAVKEFLRKPEPLMLEDRVRQLHHHINQEVLTTIIKKYGNAHRSALLTEIIFNHVSEGGDMGHAEKNMTVRCGSRLRYPAPPTHRSL